jgi:hypothetical protein
MPMNAVMSARAGAAEAARITSVSVRIDAILRVPGRIQPPKI